MEAEIISVGTEILTGSILNTNTKFLTENLSDKGFSVHYHSAVGDNLERLKQVFSNALKRNDIILITGGLGPTQDDLTKEAIAEVLGKKLIFQEALKKDLEDLFGQRGWKMTDNNLRQCYIPEDAIILPNPGGTATGIYIKDQDKHIFLIPGPPREMKTVYEGSIESILDGLNSETIESRYYHLTGIGESIVEDKILDLVTEQTNPTIATYAKPGEVLIRVTASGDNTKDLLDKVDSIIKERFNKYIFTYSQETLADTVGRYLIDHDLTISTAESCTGGLISQTLTNIPGISKSFLLGVASYANEAKVKVLGVKEETLEQFGAVSKETCTEMCENVRKILNCDIGISVTGVAGPGGGTIDKPVGLVYTGISTENGTRIIENHFHGSRDEIRYRSMNMVFQMIREAFFISY